MLELLLNQRAQLCLVVVLELLGGEIGAELLDEGCRHLQLLRTDLAVLPGLREVSLADLVPPEQPLEHQNVPAHAHGAQSGLLPQRKLHNRGQFGLFKGAAQQRVGLGRFRIGGEVVAAFEHDGIDLFAGHKLNHLDLAALLRRKGLHVRPGEHHRPLTVVVGLVDVLVVDLLAADLAAALVSDPAAIGVVHLVELDVVVLRGAIGLDRHIDKPERDGSGPDCSHVPSQAPWAFGDQRMRISSLLLCSGRPRDAGGWPQGPLSRCPRA